MLLKNASERKRQRQLGALSRLEDSRKRGYYIDRFGNYRKINPKLNAREVKVLKKRTLFSRRDIRTKKIRNV